MLVSKSVIHPTALTIDFAMENTIYWADHSLNTIEMIKPDGSGRTIVLRGDSVDRPSSLDVFESTLYWISTGINNSSMSKSLQKVFSSINLIFTTN